MKHSYGHTFLLVISFMSMIAALGVYAYMSHAVTVSADNSLSAREAVAAAQSNKNREDSFMLAYQSTSDSWARLPQLFVSSDNEVAFIESLEALGPATGATTTLSTIDADNLDNAPQNTIGSIRAHVESSGSWSSVMRVLELAELMPFKSSVSAVHLDESSDAGKHTWKMTFDIKALMIAKGSAASSTPQKSGTQ